MTVGDADLEQIHATVAPLLHQRPWKVQLGHGSFLTLDFGPPTARWHLWVYCCAWRLDQADAVVAASEDDRDDLRAAVACLEGRALEEVEVTGPALDTVLRFEGGLVLTLFPVLSRDYEHWFLYLPGGDVLTVGPGATWSVTPGGS